MIPDIPAQSPFPARSVLRGKISPSRLHPIPRNLANGAAFVVGGIITGAVGWSGHVLALPVAIAFPALWAFAPSRTVAALVAAGYFLSASRGLLVGASTFFGEQLAIGFAFWIAASILFVAVHTMLWPAKGGWHRPLRYAVAAMLMSVPPFGIAGWASPITAAGIVFSGWGWFGLAAMAIGLLVMTTRAWPIAAFILGGFYAWSAATWTPPAVPEGWAGINTGFRFIAAGQYADYAQQLETISLVKEAAGRGTKAVVLPESAFGHWGATTKQLWRRELAGLDVRVNGGAAVIDPKGYDNVIVEIAPEGTRVLYQQRMPVPVSMWQPWLALTGGGGSANAYFFANPVVEFVGYRAAPLICYEQLIVWPILQSMLHEPEVIIAIGNGWWTGNTNIVAIQKSSAEAWASLFGVGLVMAFNT